jgi:hypothetical protein
VLKVGWHGRAREAGNVGAADAGQCPTSETMPATGAAQDGRPAVKYGATGGNVRRRLQRSTSTSGNRVRCSGQSWGQFVPSNCASRSVSWCIAAR